MTYNKKTIPFVFAFAALMLAWPMTAPEVNADGTVTIPGICGITADASVNMGTLTKGVDGTETTVLTISTDGNTPGTLEVTPGDWLSSGNEATGNLVLGTVIATDSVTIGGNLFTAHATNQDDDEFAVGGTPTITATNLVTAINLKDDITTAKSINNVVLLKTKAIAPTSDGTTLAQTGGTITLSAATMDDGTDPNVKIMESTATKFVLKTDGTSPTASSAYSAKTALGADAVKTIMVVETDPDQDVKIIWHISGDSTFVASNEYQGGVVQDLVYSTTCN